MSHCRGNYQLPKKDTVLRHLYGYGERDSKPEMMKKVPQ